MAARNTIIDIYRAIGIIFIVLAHVNPPQLIWHLRSFDVVLMVVVSTITYDITRRPGGGISYKEYAFKRLKKLVIETWKFIALLGFVFAILSMITKSPSYFPIRRLLIGCLTFSGIGYLWVIRVFIYTALLNPFIIRIKELSSKVFWIGAFLILLGYVVLQQLCQGIGGSFYAIAEISFLNVIAYGLLATVGLKVYLSNRHSQISFVIIAAFFLSAICIIQGSFSPNSHKYPPQLQYMLYGLIACTLLFIFLQSKSIKVPQFLLFISKNSLWIYFWHVVVLDIKEYYLESLKVHWLLSWFLILFIACFLTYLHNIVRSKVSLQKFRNNSNG